MNQTKDALAPTRSRQKPTSGSLKARWSQAEDQQLLKLLRSGERANWTELAPHFPGKTPQQISERWGKVVDPALVKGSWTRQEDETIIEFVHQFGTKNWTKLADLLPGRIGKQCRERWRNHLDPGNNSQPWTAEEDLLLIQLHEQYGNQWVKIAGLIPGRSDNHIKNRWNSTLKKRDPTLAVQCTTPQKRSRHRVETPSSIEQPLPKPSIDAVLSPTEQAVATPTFGWTPQLPGFDIGISPMIFGSPFMGNGQMSPWGRGTPSLAFASPRMSYPPSHLDSLDKEPPL
jgi:hypothetical protein